MPSSGSAGRMLPGVPVATTTSTGSSDKPYWSAAGPYPVRNLPWLVESEESRRQVHGVDERLSIANLEWGLRMYVGILMEMAGGYGRADGRTGGQSDSRTEGGRVRWEYAKERGRIATFAVRPTRPTALPPYRPTALPPYRPTALPPQRPHHLPIELHRQTSPAWSTDPACTPG
jgi:hypothetical protein